MKIQTPLTSTLLIALTLACATLTLSACGLEVVDKDEKPAATIAAPGAPGSEVTETAGPPRDYEILPMEAPNKYVVHFHDEWSSRLKTVKKTGATPEVVSYTQATALDGGQTYQFLFKKSGSEELEEKMIEIPLDKVFNDTVHVDAKASQWKIETNGRIFLFGKAVLINGGTPLLLSAQEIVAERAVIQTFESSLHAPADGMPGQKGGNIELRAKKIRGSLQVMQKGEDGHQGKKGAPYPDRAAARPLRPATFVPPFASCDEESQADMGEQGQPGHTGDQGGDGGNSGTFLQNVVDVTDFQLDLHLIAGLPGAPGDPGDPQFGGRGYVASRQLRDRNGNLYTCPGRGDYGLDGPNGPVGSPGQAGHAGVVGQECRLVEKKIECK